MTTASIPELRKAHARTRAQLARAAVRYGKRALTGRGSGEDGPPSDQEARQLATPATALGGCRRSQPRQPLSGLWWAAFRLDTAKAAGDQAATIEAGKALQEVAIVVCERGPHRLRPGRQGG